MSSIAIIPARGGSKRIPRKNIESFLGKPIIAYSIETALKSNLFDEVMVSTDDSEIAEIAKKHGAKGLQGLACFNLGLLHKAKKRTEQARKCITEAVHLFEQCEAETSLKQAKEALASLG